jgi:hypothetical protein
MTTTSICLRKRVLDHFFMTVPLFADDHFNYLLTAAVSSSLLSAARCRQSSGAALLLTFRSMNTCDGRSFQGLCRHFKECRTP